MTLNRKMTPLDWKSELWAQQKAGRQADEIIRRLGVSSPTDPLLIAADEFPRLRVGGRDFGNQFDGKLRFVADKQCFVLMYNTKYDAGLPVGIHHPRTRFTIAHELGHYFIEHHHAYLVQGGRTHASINEFHSPLKIEREADAFAASLLLPSHLAAPRVNEAVLSVDHIQRIADDFQTSLMSTAIRSVELSHFPCAVAGIREGKVAWMFSSESLVEAGIYPNKRSLPTSAEEPWAEFHAGETECVQRGADVRSWFNTYGEDELDTVYVMEEYVPIPSMNTLLVLLTIDESDLFVDEDEEEVDDD